MIFAKYSVYENYLRVFSFFNETLFRYQANSMKKLLFLIVSNFRKIVSMISMIAM